MRNKNIVCTAAVALAAVIAVTGVVLFKKNISDRRQIAVIGGADGPTQIYIKTE